MKVALCVLLSFVFIACSNTWTGIKQDSSNAGQWTKEKINSGARYIEEKTR
ncbi:hypothetical protein [Campylobacter sp. MG1]|uniref:hypothetical protein n=1 Tax=Campylobacter sp. MG1 TaxID=2976332 RepID=UPI00226CADED|nr:hypothetical protein [Campylobacter sp. MG1]